eukprot:scaffold368413_cov36-Prasinocladus_malaysianus.AAC.1
MNKPLLSRFTPAVTQIVYGPVDCLAHTIQDAPSDGQDEMLREMSRAIVSEVTEAANKNKGPADAGEVTKDK